MNHNITIFNIASYHQFLKHYFKMSTPVNFFWQFIATSLHAKGARDFVMQIFGEKKDSK
jgi:hypothetical protein